MSKQKSWIQYTKQGKIVPGSLVVSAHRPVNGVWYEVVSNICCDDEPAYGEIQSRQKAFVKYDDKGNIVPGSLIVTNKLPKPGIWKEVYINICCKPSTIYNLRLTFDSIENANTLVGDASNVTDWNTFFDLPAYGNPFTSVTIDGDAVMLIGGSNIKVKPGLMYYEGYNYLTGIDDTGCITSVGGDAFSYCELLTDVNLPNCTIVYGYEDSPNTDYGGFGYCTSLVNLSIPKLITAGKYAFSDCYDLTSINFPNLTSAGNTCFGGCSSLTTINIPNCISLGNNVNNNNVFSEIIGNSINLSISPILLTCNDGGPEEDLLQLILLNNVLVNGSIYYPFTGYSGDLTLTFDNIASANALVGDATSLNDWNNFLVKNYSVPFTSINVVGSTITLIGGENLYIGTQFKYNQHIIEVIDTGCVAGVFKNGFDGNFALTTVNFPELTKVEAVCFDQCYLLTNINLPKVTKLEFVCFNQCFALTTISLPLVTIVGEGAFANCDSLTSISLPSCINLGPTVLNNNVFYSNAYRTITLTIPAALMTCNSGNPDGDIQYLQANNTVTIITV